LATEIIQIEGFSFPFGMYILTWEIFSIYTQVGLTRQWLTCEYFQVSLVAGKFYLPENSRLSSLSSAANTQASFQSVRVWLEVNKNTVKTWQ